MRHAAGVAQTVDLPFIDTHALTVVAPRERVWAAVREYVDRTLATGRASLLGRLLGAEPASGFAVAEEVAGERLVLRGRHRFSDYRLIFEVAAADRATVLHAHSYAVFPGVTGRLYRTAVIGSGVHVVATRHLLRSIARRVA